MATQIPALARLRVENRDLKRCVRCRAPAEHGHWHHRRTRSVVDEHQHATCNGIWLCGPCHEWVHKHPLEARRWGWIVSRHSLHGPCQVPLWHQQMTWVLLDHAGGYRTCPPPESGGYDAKVVPITPVE